MVNDINYEARKLFIKTLIKLKNEQELEEFLQDLFSSVEISGFSKRLLCAKLLRDKKTYRQIGRLMGMNSGTINKVHFKTKGSPLFRKLFS